MITLKIRVAIFSGRRKSVGLVNDVSKGQKILGNSQMKTDWTGKCSPGGARVAHWLANMLKTLGKAARYTLCVSNDSKRSE